MDFVDGDLILGDAEDLSLFDDFPNLDIVDSYEIISDSSETIQNKNDDESSSIAPATAANTKKLARKKLKTKSRKRKSRLEYSFETNPVQRKQVAERLLKTICELIDEMAQRIGVQIVCVVADPDHDKPIYEVYGTDPLEDVIKNNFRSQVLNSLIYDRHLKKANLTHDRKSTVRLPPLIFDGVPVSLEKTTQIQLRSFIPLLLKKLTGRGKPGWGKAERRPVWWPENVPWKNIRIDARSEEEKELEPWTQVLRQVVRSCYEYYGFAHLLLEPTSTSPVQLFNLCDGLNQKFILPSSSHEINNNDSPMLLLINANEAPLVTTDGTVFTAPNADNIELMFPSTVSLTEDNIENEGNVSNRISSSPGYRRVENGSSPGQDSLIPEADPMQTRT